MRRKINSIAYQPSFCEELLAFFNGPAFTVTEVQKRDGSISLLLGALLKSHFYSGSFYFLVVK